MPIISFRSKRYEHIGDGIGHRKGWLMARMMDEQRGEACWRIYWLPASACR